MKTNSLKHNIDINNKQANCIIKIRLNDECKNGHQDFAITGTFWEIGNPRTDRNMTHGGCCHDNILKIKPKLKIFVDLHLCDYLGNPMHATANGCYHLREGFNDKTEDIKTKFCEYYNVTSEQYDILSTAHNKVHYAILLMELNIPKQWKEKADRAIKLLEEMTGDEFVVDSTKNQFGMPTDEEISDELEKQNNGFYSEEKIAERKQQAITDEFSKLEKEFHFEAEKVRLKYSSLGEVLRVGGKKAFDNCIYYSHSNEIGLNWRGYGKQLSQDEIDNLITHCKFDSDKVKFTTKK